ncbi:HD domain-containing protein [Streptomyces sp. P6-2-1]|uniref:HD domain-containing protein n=1 Tax=Streptomyces sp. P6-2-1 TaxID=3422591 RepID=UPI003D35E36C
MTPLAEAHALAALAHAGQADKIGVPCIADVRAVAAGLAPSGPGLRMAGLLHDVIEDTDWTAARLRAAGVPDRVVAIAEAVPHTPGLASEDKIRRIAADPLATLEDRGQRPRPPRRPHGTPPRPAGATAGGGGGRRGRRPAGAAATYRAARAVLWSAAPPQDVAAFSRS